MGFISGLLIGLIVGGFVGLVIGGLAMMVSKEKDIGDKHDNS